MANIGVAIRPLCVVFRDAKTSSAGPLYVGRVRHLAGTTFPVYATSGATSA